MRVLAVGLTALAFALPAQAQQPDAPRAIRPSLQSTFVVPSLPGEAVRVTTYARRPTQRGRLSRRYRGIRVNRSPSTGLQASPARVVARPVETPRHRFVRRGGSYFQVVPAR